MRNDVTTTPRRLWLEENLPDDQEYRWVWLTEICRPEERHLTPHLIRLSSRPTWLDRPVLAAGLSHSSPSEPSMTMAFHAARLVRKRKSVGFHILEQRYHILSSGTRHSRRGSRGWCVGTDREYENPSPEHNNNRRVCKIKNIDNKEYSVTMFFHSKVTEDQIVDLMKAFAQADKVSFLFFLMDIPFSIEIFDYFFFFFSGKDFWIVSFPSWLTSNYK